MDVAQWLSALGLDQYCSLFAENDIDDTVLTSIDNEDLKDLGVRSLGHRKRLLAAIAEFQGNDRSARAEVAVTAPGAAVTSISSPASSAVSATPTPRIDVPRHLASRILQSSHTLAGERKQVTVLFADIKGSMALIAGTDPDYASQIIDPTVEAMMDAVHRFEGTVNRVLGDGIMALFGAPLAHEDHAVRACYAALAMRTALTDLSERTRREVGIDMEVRIGLNSGEVIVRAISNDLTLNYDAIGETVHLGARMEQTAQSGSIRITQNTFQLARDYIQTNDIGALPIKGMDEPVHAYELTGASAIRTRIQASAASGFTPFVGRKPELALIEQSQTSANQGSGQVVAVVGEPGVGKSRLYYEYLHSSRMDTWMVLECGTVSHGRASAYMPIADLLRGYFGIGIDDDSRTIHEKVLGRILTLDDSLRDTLPALLNLLEVPVDDVGWLESDPPARRLRTRESVKALLLREARDTPIVLVFEDLHWFDQESLGIVSALIDGLGANPILMLVNYRPEFTETWPSKGHLHRVQLQPLSAASMDDMLDRLLGPHASLASVRTLLAERTEGNPLFLEESIAALVETGRLVGSRGEYHLAGGEEEISTPASVQAVLAARMDRLEPDYKYLLQCAAVIGKDFALALLRDIVDVGPDALAESLDTLQATEFIYETRLFPDKEYTFKHALTHDVAYSSLVADRRRTLHGRILEAMQRLYPERLNENLERIAHHAARAEQWEEAIRFGWESGQRLIEQNAMRPALESFQIVLDAFERMHEPDQHLAAAIDTHSQMRDCYFVLGEHERVRPHLDAAAVLSERTGDVSKVAWGRLQMSAFYWAAGMLEDAVSEGQTALEVGGHLVEENFDALAHYRIGTVLTALGRFPDAIGHLDRALVRLDTEENRRFFQFGGWPYCFVCSFLSWSLAEAGNLDRAAALAESGYSLAAGERQAYSQCVATFGLAHVMLTKGQSEFAIPVLERSLEMARSGDAGATQPWIASRLVYAYALEGMETQALETLEDNLDEAGFSKGPHHGASYDWVVRGLYQLGRYDDTYRYLDLLEARARRQAESAVLAWAQLYRIKTDLATHRLDEKQAAQQIATCQHSADRLSMGTLSNACNDARHEIETRNT